MPEIVDKERMNLSDSVAKQYLRKMIEDAQSKEIEVMLLNLPSVLSKQQQEWLNSAKKIADEYGIVYLDLNSQDAIINYNTDFLDVAHMNSSGARKTTEVLGSYISEQYSLPDHRNDAIASQWNQDYMEYIGYKVEWMQAQTSLASELMLLCDKRFNALIEVYNSDIQEDERYVHLLENLEVAGEELTDSTELIVVARGYRTDVIAQFRDSGTPVETGIGEVACVVDENGVYTVSINGEDQYSVASDRYVDVRIAVFDSGTDEMVACLEFINGIVQ